MLRIFNWLKDLILMAGAYFVGVYKGKSDEKISQYRAKDKVTKAAARIRHSVHYDTSYRNRVREFFNKRK